MNSLTGFAKFLLVSLVVGSLGAGYWYSKKTGLLSKIVPDGKQTQEVQPGAFADAGKSSAGAIGTVDRPVRVAVVTWPGYAGGQYFNRGFKANPDSQYVKQYNMYVEFLVMDDYEASRAAWKADKVDLLWSTADSFPTESTNLTAFEPKIVFQADWSRGGDAIVSTDNIKSIADLRGKTIAVAEGTPSHTFLLWCLSAGGLKYSEVTIKKAPSAIDAATYFKNKQVDAAVVWAPDDQDCISARVGTHILKNTRSASNIIADVFYAKKSFLEAHPKEVKNLIEGWMKGSAEINNSPAAKSAAVKILRAGLSMPEAYFTKSIDNVRLTTLGDNVNFFNLNGNFKGVKGEELYGKMTQLYALLNLADSKTPTWRQVVDTSFLSDIKLTGNEHAAEGSAKFEPLAQVEGEKADAFSTKQVTITFASGSATLDSNAKYIIDKEFADLARTFAKARIRIEGNTDSTGGASINATLSRQRAQAVADFLANQYKFDMDRFTIVGNGPAKPVADNNTDEGREKNRRTDFSILN